MRIGLLNDILNGKGSCGVSDTAPHNTFYGGALLNVAQPTASALLFSNIEIAH